MPFTPHGHFGRNQFPMMGDKDCKSPLARNKEAGSEKGFLGYPYPMKQIYFSAETACTNRSLIPSSKMARVQWQQVLQFSRTSIFRIIVELRDATVYGFLDRSSYMRTQREREIIKEQSNCTPT